jgi:uncharacterized membrane protein
MAAGRRNGRGSLATTLGWASLGLAAAQLGAPRRLARAIGADDDGAAPTVVRLVGLREAAAGIGILARARPVGWLRARVAGDVADLALLGVAATRSPRSRTRLGLAAGTVVGIAALDALAARTVGEADGRSGRIARRAVTVKKPAKELYAMWHDFEAFPRFMTHVESVSRTGDDRYRWRVKGPAGRIVEWESETLDDRPGERISWRSLPGADVWHHGSVDFRKAPGKQGTEIHVELEYDPPAGAIGVTVAKLLGREPEAQLADDLHRFKQLAETGEVLRSDGTPEGASLAQHLRQRAAQPLSEEEPVPVSAGTPTTRGDAR